MNRLGFCGAGFIKKCRRTIFRRGQGATSAPAQRDPPGADRTGMIRGWPGDLQAQKFTRIDLKMIIWSRLEGEMGVEMRGWSSVFSRILLLEWHMSRHGRDGSRPCCAQQRQCFSFSRRARLTAEAGDSRRHAVRISQQPG